MPLPVTVSVCVEFEALLLKEMVPEAVPLICGVKVTLNGTVWPAFKVSGKVIPLTTNSELLEVAEEMLTLEPLALSEAGWGLELVPTTTLPKLRAVGDSVNWPGVVLLPESGMLKFGFEAFESSESVPLAVPLTVGANATLKVTLCPADKLCGRFNPLRLKPAPEVEACVIVKLEPPELVSVSSFARLVPTARVPKLILEGFGLSDAGVAPVPDSTTLRVGLEPLFAIARFPLMAPLDSGVNVTLSVAVCPAASVRGKFSVPRLNPEPVTVACEIVTLALPELFRVTDCV